MGLRRRELGNGDLTWDLNEQREEAFDTMQ
jgi:hypothetical protein